MRDQHRPWDPIGETPQFQQFDWGHLRVWSWPVQGRRYIVGVDVAEGKQRDLGRLTAAQIKTMDWRAPDNSAAVVIEEESGEHVATWCGLNEPHEFAEAVAALGLHYNTAHIIPERNTFGEAVVDKLVRVLRYPDVYVDRMQNRTSDLENHQTTVFGWKTQRNTRPMLITRIHEWLQAGGVTRDEELLKELRTMQFDPQGEPRAIGKDKDDRVIALGLALQARYQILYGEIGTEAPVAIESKLDPYEQMIWRKAEEIRKRHGIRDGGDGGRLGRLPRLGRPGSSGGFG